MDKNAIKKYAVWARTELIDRVTQKALQYGITEKEGNPAGEPSFHRRCPRRQWSAKLTQYVENAKGHIREIFGYGLSDDVLLDESSNSIIKAEEKQSAKSQLQITNSTNRKKSAPDYSDADFPLENPSNMSTFSNDSNFFKTNSSSKVFLVERPQPKTNTANGRIWRPQNVPRSRPEGCRR